MIRTLVLVVAAAGLFACSEDKPAEAAKVDATAIKAAVDAVPPPPSKVEVPPPAATTAAGLEQGLKEAPPPPAAEKGAGW